MRLQLHALRRVVDKDHILQFSAQNPQILQIGIFLPCAILAVVPLGNQLFFVQEIDNVVGVLVKGSYFLLSSGEDHDFVVLGHELEEDIHEGSQPYEDSEEGLIVATWLVELVVEVFHQFCRRVHQCLVQVQYQQFLLLKRDYLEADGGELCHVRRVKVWLLLISL